MMFGWFKPKLPCGWVQGFKVIRVKDRTSAVVFDAAVEYPLGHVAYPKFENGPLTVFTNKQDAKAFCLDTYDCATGAETVVNCIYKESSEMSVYKVDCFRGVEMRRLNTLPPGTALASAVICLE